MVFDEKRINEGIDSYNEIMRQVNTPAFCSEPFKKLFNGFYRIRQKPASWYDTYYGLFQRCKDNDLSFYDVLSEMFDETKEIDPSFCSKMIATIHPEMPIWDQYVLAWLGIHLKNPKDKKARIRYYSDIYDIICKEINAHLNDWNIKEAIKEFDIKVPNGREINIIKKIDFMLWSNRSDRTVSILDYNHLLDIINGH